MPSLNTTRPCDKLAFDLNGTLYAVDRDNKSRLPKIDTQTGAWLSYQNFEDHFSACGDFAFGADSKFYNLNGYNSKFQVADLANNTLATVNYANLDDLSGIACGSSGTLYIRHNNGARYAINPANAQTTYLGNAGIPGLEDLASGHIETELSYANVSLNIPAGAVNVDVEIEMSMETTELVGDVALTFSPHGTVFNTPAILNITAHGVDFTGVDPNTIDIYYDNQETGVLEPMQKDQLIVDVNAGTMQVINVQLPHFSRYKLGAE